MKKYAKVVVSDQLLARLKREPGGYLSLEGHAAGC
jgi:hypothetical protein